MWALTKEMRRMSDLKENQRGERQILIYAKTLGGQSVHGWAGKQKPVWIINGSYKIISFAVWWAGDFVNNRLRWFLDEDDVKVRLSLKDDVNDKVILANVLRKYPEIL